MEERYFWENESGPDLNGAEFLGKYGSGPDKKWRSKLWENSTKQGKRLVTEKEVNGTGLEKKRRGMLAEHRRKREKDEEDFLKENESMPEKKRA
ncbi:hypothetical protein T11_10271 [Trichinella zimbabwensis]|uniref:Uncharacterized protein n=1 Tax=Trichinella zimbabwensis TaxID=268475 RepID=A0A0V1GTW2_9BILA|nr:hypothetical protein T11_10271 [Trichinella zimbabwensis]